MQANAANRRESYERDESFFREKDSCANSVGMCNRPLRKPREGTVVVNFMFSAGEPGLDIRKQEISADSICCPVY